MSQEVLFCAVLQLLGMHNDALPLTPLLPVNNCDFAFRNKGDQCIAGLCAQPTAQKDAPIAHFAKNSSTLQKDTNVPTTGA